MYDLEFARRFSLAPMMDWTDRHYRFVFRQISSQALLYTEMIHAEAIIQGNRDRLLGYNDCEHPIACQLGGSSPISLAKAARIVADYGYDEVNLNCGCPSDRVQAGEFGAALMARTSHVADLMKAMQDATSLPVTLKHRLGIEGKSQDGTMIKGWDDYGLIRDFVGTIHMNGVQIFIVHARIAMLNGLSPKENRSIPPLDYAKVKKLAQDFPNAQFILNGGIETMAQASQQASNFDGVMVGRAGYKRPFDWITLDSDLYDQAQSMLEPAEQYHSIILNCADYCQAWIEQGGNFKEIARHLLGFFNGIKGASHWRYSLTNLIQTASPQSATLHLRKLADEMLTIAKASQSQSQSQSQNELIKA